MQGLLSLAFSDVIRRGVRRFRGTQIERRDDVRRVDVRFPLVFLGLVIVGVLGRAPLLLFARGDEPEAPRRLPTRFREPLALGISKDGTRLFTANRRSGSVSEIDLRSNRVLAEHEVGAGLADLAVLPDGKHLLAVDQTAAEVLLIALGDGPAVVLQRLRVSSDPVSLVVRSDGASCMVASLWSRRVSVLELAKAEGVAHPVLTLARTVELPFSPRNLTLASQGTRLLVADAFGGRVAVVDPRVGTISRVLRLPGHNIRGMALSPDGESLVLAHQVILPEGRTSYEDIHWGLCINNDLRVLKLSQVLEGDPATDVLKSSRHLHLGDPGNGSGDPSSVAFDLKGHVIVTLSGIDEVLIGTDPGVLSYRPAVGRRPMAVAIDRDGRTAYVANSLDDTISVLDLETGRRRETIILGPCPDLDAVERGRRLFSDARLSHGGWMSCQSCHTDGHSNGQNSDTLGDGDFGAPKRVPSLLGAAFTGPWGWNGSFKRLEEQVFQSIESTMQGQEPPRGQVADLIAYLRTLAPPPSSGAAEPAVVRGRGVFNRECARCHAPPFYTSPRTYDVGIVDEAGNRMFNPPSLRGSALRDPLLHDGRAHSLEEVLGKQGHPQEAELSRDERADLLEFLKTL